MFKHSLLATTAGAALLLGTPRADAQLFNLQVPGVSVQVGPGGVHVGVGRGPVYYGYPAVGVPGYSSSRYYQYGWGGYPFYPGVYSPPYMNVYPPPGVGGTYSYGVPTVPSVPQVGGYQSFYPPQQQQQAVPARPVPVPPAPNQANAIPTPRQNPPPPAQDTNSVLLNVRLPEPNAELWIDGTRATRQGATRQFISPPLTPGRRYSYDLQARWLENGREVMQTRRVIVEAGQQLAVDFTQPPRPGEEVPPRPGQP